MNGKIEDRLCLVEGPAPACRFQGLKRLVVWVTLVAFVLTSVGPVSAQQLALPAPGTMVQITPAFAPTILKGMKVYPEEPLRVDFIVDTGDLEKQGIENDDNDPLLHISNAILQSESSKLIRYFLAALTIPEEDLWVNLSPYEKDRIIPDTFSRTEMGRDLLAQDYILKQLTASIIYPEGETGKVFWKKVYGKVFEMYGTTDIPVDTFNKVWITPDEATVYVYGQSAVIKSSHLKVQLESDYLAQSRAEGGEARDGHDGAAGTNNSSQGAELLSSEPTELAKSVLREIVLPLIEKEVNEGENFAQLRQIYHAMVLATWFKRNLKESVLGRSYTDQSKVGGIDLAEQGVKEKIWQQYVEAFKRGAYNYIKDEADELTGEVFPRKYFSGGFHSDAAAVSEVDVSQSQMAAAVSDSAGKTVVAAVNLIASKQKGTRGRYENEKKELAAPIQNDGGALFVPNRKDVAMSHLGVSSGNEVFVYTLAFAGVASLFVPVIFGVFSPWLAVPIAIASIFLGRELVDSVRARLLETQPDALPPRVLNIPGAAVIIPPAPSFDGRVGFDWKTLEEPKDIIDALGGQNSLRWPDKDFDYRHDSWFEKLAETGLAAHGCRSGLSHFLGIILNGLIAPGARGVVDWGGFVPKHLQEGLPIPIVNSFGPYFVIVYNEWVKGNDLSFGLPEYLHNAYVVPNTEVKMYILDFLDKAVEEGYLDVTTAQLRKAKVVTYEEAVMMGNMEYVYKAPTGQKVVADSAQIQTDAVLGEEKAKDGDLGGIDLNSRSLNLREEGAGMNSGVNLNVAALGDIDGLVPLILSITPLSDPQTFFIGVTGATP